MFPSMAKPLVGTLIVGLGFLTQVHSVSLPPSVDPFYQPSAKYTSQHPGAIIRSRSVEAPDSFNGSARAFQLVYRSQDSQGVPTVGVTTVYVPQNAKTVDRIISLQTPYDSTDVDCSPSYILTSDPNSISAAASIPTYLNQGWAVSVPDFEGFFAAFGNGLQAGYSTLDSVRAVLASREVTKISNKARVALVGGSGGAIGSEFALELLHEYAPELKSRVVGALLLSLVPDGNSTVVANDGTATAGLIPLFLQGLAKQYDELADWLSGALLPSQAASFFGATTQCGDAFAISYVFRKSSSYLNSTTALQEAIPQKIFLDAATMGRRGVPSQPMFYYKGVKDTLSPIADTDALISKYCSHGAEIIYQRSANSDHGLAGSYGAVVGFPWLVDRLNGVPAAKGCHISNVTVPASYALAHSGL